MRFLVAFFLSLALTCKAITIEGRVVRVSDGDTITVLDASKIQYKVRLSGIDAPEKEQPFGNRAKVSLSELIFDKNVTVYTDKQDRYGRKIGKVLINGSDVNLELIKRGMAWHYKTYEHEQPAIDRSAYVLAENEAKAARRGLWNDLEPISPWEYRKAKRKDVWIITY